MRQVGVAAGGGNASHFSPDAAHLDRTTRGLVQPADKGHPGELDLPVGWQDRAVSEVELGAGLVHQGLDAGGVQAREAAVEPVDRIVADALRRPAK